MNYNVDGDACQACATEKSTGSTPHAEGENPSPKKPSKKYRRKFKKFIGFVHSQNWNVGDTKHQQTYDCFLRAADLGLDPAEAAQLVLEHVEKSGGRVSSAAFQRQLQRAYDFIGSGGADGVVVSGVPRRAKPEFRPEVLAAVADKVAIDDIVEFVKAKSPISPDGVTRSDFLSHIFRAGEKVVVFDVMNSQGQFVWDADAPDRDGLPSQGPEGVWYLVNPVDGEFHYNPRETKDSRRSEESVTSWRHLVLESDAADPILWLKAVVQMPLRIRAIYTSGGKSIHALVGVDAKTKHEWDEIKNTLKHPLVALGADLGAMTAVRLSRLPQTWRGDRRQELLYLDPHPDGTPIRDKHRPAIPPATTDEPLAEVAHA